MLDWWSKYFASIETLMEVRAAFLNILNMKLNIYYGIYVRAGSLFLELVGIEFCGQMIQNWVFKN